MIGLRDVCFSYGKREILKNLDFSVRPGECVVLAGPNGSGKSTALSVLAGILRPDSGEVCTDGSIGFVPQGAALFEDMSVGDNLRFFAGLSGGEIEKPLPFHVDQMWKKKVSKLSGGMKKRVSIACALLGSPRIMLFDEPCAALDIEYRDELISLIHTLKDRGCAIVYVGHDPMEFASFYDKLIFMDSKATEYTREQLSGDPADDNHFCATFLDLFRERK